MTHNEHCSYVSEELFWTKPDESQDNINTEETQKDYLHDNMNLY